MLSRVLQQLSLLLASTENQSIRLNRAVQKSTAHTLRSSRFSLVFGDFPTVMSEGQSDDGMECQEYGNPQPINISSSADQDMEDVSQGSNAQAITVQMVQSGQFSNGQGTGGRVVTQQPLRTIGHDNMISPAQIIQSNDQDFSAAGAESLDSRHLPDHMKHQNITSGQTNQSDSEKNLPSSRVEGQDSRSSLDEQKHQDITTNKSDSQPEEDICKNGDINTTQSQPSAPLDIANLKIKVDWTEPFPDKWSKKLQIAIQRWLSKLEGAPSVHSIKLMDDQSLAQVQITPSTALETLENHGTVSLNFKHENKDATAQIFLDEAHSVTVSQNTSTSDKNRIPSSKVSSLLF
ncbi:uncharacterized protein LOC107654801 isoform X2 [Sinocyclocheilus anshuiensis]|uniref:uncharacterized protein LOC107654801 isoform X2 n=1 Tax=Sinocyclocheilus anshuiensis TaxID=1608454 RepID=UPI0007B7A7E9|nr:PREDICTED: uncharacterized protein LOC107654801 isoform X2 [Sinocyclocheilus anshuiensis]